MKKLLILLCSLALLTGVVYAEESDEYDSDFVYETNGSGDQYFRISLLGNIPLNFNIDGQQKLYVGGTASFAYYRFLNSWLALGGEISPTFNHTIGNNDLTTVPMLMGVTVLPTIGKFEFPVSLAAGIAFETCQNMTYFPGFAAKAGLGAYYRATEMWSFGLECHFTYLPQWYTDPKYNKTAMFIVPGISARYHF